MLRHGYKVLDSSRKLWGSSAVRLVVVFAGTEPLTEARFPGTFEDTVVELCGLKGNDRSCGQGCLCLSENSTMLH